MPSDEDFAKFAQFAARGAAPLYVADQSDAQSARNQLPQAGTARTI
jgi:hypothetical protein